MYKAILNPDFVMTKRETLLMIFRVLTTRSRHMQQVVQIRSFKQTHKYRNAPFINPAFPKATDDSL
jgi:hypothetical protein